jgi:hypothetical protein
VSLTLTNRPRSALAPGRLPAAEGAATGVPDDGSGVAGAAFDEFSPFEHAIENSVIPIRIVVLSRFISAGSASVGMHVMTHTLDRQMQFVRA